MKESNRELEDALRNFLSSRARFWPADNEKLSELLAAYPGLPQPERSIVLRLLSKAQRPSLEIGKLLMSEAEATEAPEIFEIAIMGCTHHVFGLCQKNNQPIPERFWNILNHTLRKSYPLRRSLYSLIPHIPKLDAQFVNIAKEYFKKIKFWKQEYWILKRALRPYL